MIWWLIRSPVAKWAGILAILAAGGMWLRVDAVNRYKESLVTEWEEQRQENREDATETLEGIREIGDCDLYRRMLERVRDRSETDIAALVQRCVDGAATNGEDDIVADPE